MDREQIVDMVNAMMADKLDPVSRGMAEMRERLIGIDSNGSGRAPGAIQRLQAELAETRRVTEDKIDGVCESVKAVGDQVSGIAKTQGTWTKVGVSKTLTLVLTLTFGLVATILGLLTYYHSQHPDRPMAGHSATITTPTSSDAGVDGR